MFEMMALSFFCNASISPHHQHQAKVKVTSSKGLEEVKNLIRTVGIPSKTSSSPAKSLENGKWVKLICGASFEDVVDIRNRSLVYTLAGVDCIDCAADVSVVSAVNACIKDYPEHLLQALKRGRFFGWELSNVPINTWARAVVQRLDDIQGSQ